MRLYFDKDVSVEIAANLKSRGFDVLTVRDAGRRHLADEAQLACAVQEQRTIVTHNRADFELTSRTIPRRTAAAFWHYHRQTAPT